MTLDNKSTIGGPAQARDADEHASIGDAVHRITNAAREAVDAELSLVRLRAAVFGSAAKWIAMFGVIAIITAFATIVTLMVGAVLALAPHWGLGFALLAVTGVALLAVILCGLVIKAQFARMRSILP